MAKRKRLTPATVDSTIAPSPAPAAGLTRGLGGGRPPIADVAHDAAATSALNEVAQTLTEARNEGRLIQKIPLAQIDETYLVRDRIETAPDEMAALLDSLRARGQQTAIEVAALEDGRYGLISGWRRLAALRTLSADKESPELDTILAIIRAPQDAADAYVAMVEENEIRVNLSFYERARIVAQAVDKDVYRTDRLALAALFSAVPRAKRSKIGSFIPIVRRLDDVLRFPTALTEKAGLTLAKALETDPGLAARLNAALQKAKPATAQEETRVIAGVQCTNIPRPKANLQSVTDGLYYILQSNGSILLQGPALSDPAYVDRLVLMLKDLK